MSITEAARESPAQSGEKSPSGHGRGEVGKSTSNKLPLTMGLALSCIGLGLYAAFGSSGSTPETQPIRATPAVQTSPSLGEDRGNNSELPEGHPPTGIAALSGAALSGKVQEAISVSNYTYLRVQPPSAEEFWAAVTKTNVPLGSEVSFEGAELMTNFSSKELGRTFERIYFGRLAGGAGLDPRQGGDFPAPTKEEGEAAKRAASLMAEEIPIKGSAKATGATGRTVAEIYTQSQSLIGKKVRVRGTIVKVTRQVMGTNFLHLRDGSGDPGKGTHDIAMKLAQEPPPLGAESEFEATVLSDVNLGSGYSYPVLLEDARIVGR